MRPLIAQSVVECGCPSAALGGDALVMRTEPAPKLIECFTHPSFSDLDLGLKLLTGRLGFRFGFLFNNRFRGAALQLLQRVDGSSGSQRCLGKSLESLGDKGVANQRD